MFCWLIVLKAVLFVCALIRGSRFCTQNMGSANSKEEDTVVNEAKSKDNSSYFERSVLLDALFDPYVNQT